MWQHMHELRKYDVEIDYVCSIPNSPFEGDLFSARARHFSQYDMVIIQRCYLFPIVVQIVEVCKFLGIPVCFEIDDDYMNIIPSNPAYYSLSLDQPAIGEYFQMRNQASIDQSLGKEVNIQALQEKQNYLEIQRLAGLDGKLCPQCQTTMLKHCKIEGHKSVEYGYTEVLRVVDWVITSTIELARTIYPYNKNVIVFENCMERVYPYKNEVPVNEFLEVVEGVGHKVVLKGNFDYYQVPSYNKIEDKKVIMPLARVGYVTSQSHRYEDFYTIKDGLNKVYDNLCGTNPFFTVFMGDGSFTGNEDDENLQSQMNRGYLWFLNQIDRKYWGNVFSLPGAPYEKFIYNMSNVDIALCPLAPTMFNMSKSDLKLLEAGAWGVAGLAPRFITYTRNWTEEENCLMYGNQEEFVEQLSRLIKDRPLREKIGSAAKEYIRENRLEKHQAEARYEFYKKVTGVK